MENDRHTKPVEVDHYNIVCIVVGMLTLAFGVLVYVLDRPAQHVYFISGYFSLFDEGSLTFGVAGQNLPSFIHVFSLSLITIGVLNSTRYLHLALICLLWALVNTFFEIGQHNYVSEILIESIPDWFDKLPLLDATRFFFLSGTFDVFDLIGIIIGATCAYLFTITIGRNKYD